MPQMTTRLFNIIAATVLIVLCGFAFSSGMAAEAPKVDKADELDRACKAWAKHIHRGKRYGPGLGEDMIMRPGTVVTAVYIWGRKVIRLDSKGFITNATCG